MTDRITSDPSLQAYLATPIGEQMRVHLDRRAAIRRDVPLLPRRWAELLTLWRRPAASGRGRTATDRLASQTK